MDCTLSMSESLFGSGESGKNFSSLICLNGLCLSRFKRAIWMVLFSNFLSRWLLSLSVGCSWICTLRTESILLLLVVFGTFSFFSISFSIILLWMILAIFWINGLHTGGLGATYFGFYIPKTEQVGGFRCWWPTGGARIVLKAVDYWGCKPRQVYWVYTGCMSMKWKAPVVPLSLVLRHPPRAMPTVEDVVMGIGPMDV